jgi:tetratricopeptide (TPR) repeat protein
MIAKIRLIPLFLPLLMGITALTAGSGTESLFSYGTGVRAMGMGHAYAGIADDASALFWNPGGLARLQYNEAMGLHAQLFYGTIYNSGLLVYPTMQLGTYGLGILRIGTGGIVFRDNQNITLKESLSADQWQFILGYGVGSKWPLSAGTAIKVNTFKFGTYYDANVSFDLGILFKPYGKKWKGWTDKFEVNNLSIGLVLKDFLSTPILMRSVSLLEPWNLKLGFAYSYDFRKDARHRLLADMDLNYTSGKGFHLNVGAEYGLMEMFFLRAGFDQSLGFMLGTGVYYRKIRLDYSMTLQSIGFGHRVSLLWRFGKSIDEQFLAVLQENEKTIQSRISGALKAQESENLKTLEEMASRFSNTLKDVRKELSDQFQKEKLIALSNAALRARQDQAAAIANLNRQFELERSRLESEYSNRMTREIESAISKMNEQYEADKKRVLEEMSQKSQAEREEIISQLNARYEQEKKALASSLSNQFNKDKAKAIADVNRRNAQEKANLTQKLIEQEKAKRQNMQGGIAAFESGDYDEAIRIFELMLKTDPNQADAQEYLRRARAAKIDPSTYPKEILETYRTGLALYAQGDIEGAIVQWKKILEKDPYNHLAYKSVLEAETRLKNLKDLKKKE